MEKYNRVGLLKSKFNDDYDKYMYIKQDLEKLIALNKDCNSNFSIASILCDVESHSHLIYGIYHNFSFLAIYNSNTHNITFNDDKNIISSNSDYFDILNHRMDNDIKGHSSKLVERIKNDCNNIFPLLDIIIDYTNNHNDYFIYNKLEYTH